MTEVLGIILKITDYNSSYFPTLSDDQKNFYYAIRT